MSRPPTERILAGALLFVFIMPRVSFAFPMATLGGMAGGCHGNHGLVPVPSHNCCCAAPRAPAQLPVTASSTPLSVVIADVVPLKVMNASPTIALTWDADISPPPQTILRI